MRSPYPLGGARNGVLDLPRGPLLRQQPLTPPLLTLPPICSGLVPLAFFIMFIVNIWMSFQVGAARRKYNIPYPTLYAVAGTPRNYGPVDPSPTAPLTTAGDSAASKSELISNEDAYAFNCVQRGHQNSLENFWLVSVLALVNWGFPIPTGFSLLLWVFGRIAYMRGYTAGVKTRNSIVGALLTYPALLCLWGLTLATAVHLFRGTAAYSLV